eukprot:1153202-Rhodomonas_salina.2
MAEARCFDARHRILLYDDFNVCPSAHETLHDPVSLMRTVLSERKPSHTDGSAVESLCSRQIA